MSNNKKNSNANKADKKKAVIRFIVFFLALIMIFAAVIWPFIVYADDITDMQSELSDINADIAALTKKIKAGQSEASTLASEIKAVEKKIYSAQIQVNKLKAQVNSTKAEINQTMAELSQMEEDMSKHNETINTRLRIMYKNGDISLLSVLFGSVSMTDFLTNMEMAKRIYNADKEILLSMQSEYNAIEDKKAELAALKEKLISEQNSLQANVDALTASEESLSKQKKSIENNNAQLEAQIDALNDEAEKISAEILKLQSSNAYSGGTMCWPSKASSRITSAFGNRLHPILKKYKLHTGIDIGAASGTDILAANSGTVITSAYNAGGYGYYLIVDHGGGIVTLYAHCSKILVKKGDVVTRGQTIAKVGSTGMSTGAHLHFEVRVNGSYVNPLDYVTAGKY